MKHHSLSKVLKRLACVLAALVIALAVAVFALWHNELATLSSLKKTVQFTSSTSRAATTLTISWPRAAHPLTLSSSPSSPRASPRASSP